MLKRLYWLRGIVFVMTHIGSSYEECKHDLDCVLKKFSYRRIDGFTLGVISMSKVIPVGFLLNVTEATFNRTTELTANATTVEILIGK